MQCHTLQENCILLALLLLCYSLCAQKGEKKSCIYQLFHDGWSPLEPSKEALNYSQVELFKEKERREEEKEEEKLIPKPWENIGKTLQNLLHPKYIFQFICLCWVVFSVVQCTAKNVYIYFLRNSVVVCFPGVLFSRLE